MGDTAPTEGQYAKATSALQSSEHGQLLDVIDHLRALGIDRRVPLPQLVVCGDQNSGKSSVLEAVSGVRFPTKDTLCTRFATELILRRSVSQSVDIQIRPSHDRSEDEKAKLLAFKPSSDNIDEFPQLVEAAKDAIGIDDHAKRFSEDVLSVEVSGPQQPHLTLVDLPGVYHSGNKRQSVDEAKLVNSLVQRYMKNTRSIILAVVSAKNDSANQIVTQMARTFDPNGTRTLGIVTKPDTLLRGSDSEGSFITLLKNEDVVFRLGWHVLRNRDFDMKDYSTEERDEEEKQFFSKGVWTSLPATIVGIGPLKPRLGDILRKQIISVLPSLIADVERGIKDCNSRLHSLGDTRETLQEQRQYLIRVSQRFSVLVKAAMDGVYGDEFFGDPMTPEGEAKRLRALIQDFLLRFAEDMRRNGQQQKILDDGTERNVDTHAGKTIRHSDYVDHVRELMRRTRGRELPGTFNPLIIGDLFYEQSKPWKEMSDRYSKVTLLTIKRLLRSAIDSSTDSATAEGLLQNLLYPALEKRTSLFHTKVLEVLEPHQRGHAITYNHYFTETVQKARNEHEKQDQARRIHAYFGRGPHDGPFVTKQLIDVSELVALLGISTQEDMDRYACSEAIYCMQAYYKVAMKVLVDNFSVLAVERCMLSDLADILSPDIIIKLSDKEVYDLAAESETSALERHRATEELKVLEEGLTELNRFSRLRGAGETTDVNDEEEEEEQGAQTPPPNKDTTPPNNEDHHDREINNQSPISPFDQVVAVPREEYNYPDTPLEQPCDPYPPPATEPFQIEEAPVPRIVSWDPVQSTFSGGKKKGKKSRAHAVGFADDN